MNTIKLLLVDNQSHHRILQVNSTLLKTVLWFVPLFLGTLMIALSVLTFNSYKRISNVKESSQDQLIKWQEEEKVLRQEVQGLEQQVQDLAQKLSLSAQQGTVTGSGGERKNLFPAGFVLLGQAAGSQDLTAKSLVAVENFTFSLANQVLDIKFELHNQSGTDRTTGYFFVLLYIQGQLTIHPQIKLSAQPMAFSQGESFNIGRFRTVLVQTPLQAPPDSNMEARLVAFNRTGDLLMNQLITLK